jgi:hypothetical protein
MIAGFEVWGTGDLLLLAAPGEKSHEQSTASAPATSISNSRFCWDGLNETCGPDGSMTEILSGSEPYLDGFVSMYLTTSCRCRITLENDGYLALVVLLVPSLP